MITNQTTAMLVFYGVIFLAIIALALTYLASKK